MKSIAAATNRLLLCAVAMLACSDAAAQGPPARSDRTGKPTGAAGDRQPATREMQTAALRLLKGSVLVPLFVQQDGGFAALSVKLTATALPQPKPAPVEVVFSQIPNSSAATDAVRKHLQARHSKWPVGHKIDVTFSEKVAPADVAAMTVAAALLVDSMIEGYQIDPRLVVIGSMDAEGEIASVIGAATRVTAAVRGGVGRIIAPEKSIPQMADVMLGEGVAKFAQTQIFSASSFEEVPPLAAAELDESLVRGMETFETVVQQVGGAGDEAEQALADPEVKEALRDTLVSAPSHLTARLLLGHGTGQFKAFSLSGTLETAESRAPNLVRSVRSATPTAGTHLPIEQVNEELAKLKALRARIDERALVFLDAVIRYGETLQTWASTPERSIPQTSQLVAALNSAAATVQSEWPRLIALRDARTQQPSSTTLPPRRPLVRPKR